MKNPAKNAGSDIHVLPYRKSDTVKCSSSIRTLPSVSEFHRISRHKAGSRTVPPVGNLTQPRRFFNLQMRVYYHLVFSSRRIVRLIRFFATSTSRTLTSTTSPTLTASRGCFMYLSVILEICTSPS